MNKVAVIDYGMGNLHSVAKAVEYVGDTRPDVTADKQRILAADRVIFPGVGAMRDCMEGIRRLGIDELLPRVAEKKPVLAICVGMQALMERSDENDGVNCLGLFAGHVKRFPDPLIGPGGERLKVPHMGWNTVRQTRPHPLWQGIPDGGRFYFVHSYYAAPQNDARVVGESDYPEPFAAAIAQGNIFAVQFHPEKSQAHGLQLLKNFLAWEGRREDGE